MPLPIACGCGFLSFHSWQHKIRMCNRFCQRPFLFVRARNAFSPVHCLLLDNPNWIRCVVHWAVRKREWECCARTDRNEEIRRRWNAPASRQCSRSDARFLPSSHLPPYSSSPDLFWPYSAESMPSKIEQQNKTTKITVLMEKIYKNWSQKNTVELICGHWRKRRRSALLGWVANRNMHLHLQQKEKQQKVKRDALPSTTAHSNNGSSPRRVQWPLLTAVEQMAMAASCSRIKTAEQPPANVCLTQFRFVASSFAAGLLLAAVVHFTYNMHIMYVSLLWIRMKMLKCRSIAFRLSPEGIQSKKNSPAGCIMRNMRMRVWIDIVICCSNSSSVQLMMMHILHSQN